MRKAQGKRGAGAHIRKQQQERQQQQQQQQRHLQHHAINIIV
jgi:hypothetical protein